VVKTRLDALLVDRGPGPNVDQPFVQAATVMAGGGQASP
jgi:hypothetical protein